MKRVFERFFTWYEKYTEQNTLIATALFTTQVIHLIWLSLFVIAGRLTGQPLWDPTGFWQAVLVLVDYVEIPALIATSLLYISLLRQNQEVKKSIWYLVLVNSQWLHIFWITDEFVVEIFTSSGQYATILPAWLAWIAILIDYLELPVIYDTIKRSVKILASKK